MSPSTRRPTFWKTTRADTSAVRQFRVDALSELGYRVLEADGAAAALKLPDAHPDVALLFTDVVMREMNGRKLAEEALRRRPGLRVLFTAGYTRKAAANRGVLDPGVQLIGKALHGGGAGHAGARVLDAPTRRAAASSRPGNAQDELDDGRSSIQAANFCTLRESLILRRLRWLETLVHTCII